MDPRLPEQPPTESCHQWNTLSMGTCHKWNTTGYRSRTTPLCNFCQRHARYGEVIPIYVCWWRQTVYKSQWNRRHFSTPRRPQALSNWADTWQLTFNAKKCKTMHLGNNNAKTTYSLATSAGVSLLEPTQAKNYLEVMVDNQLTFTSHVEAAVNKANKILCLIRISYSHLDQISLRHLYTALVRPHLEYGNVAWSPRYLKDSCLLENVQHRATKLYQSYGTCHMRKG